MQRSELVLRKSWVWAACAALPLALTGCQGNRTATTANQPGDQRVAGERQEEPSAEVRAAMQQAGLPERFVFGGRTWLGHEIHRVERNKVAMTSPATVSTPPGPAGAAPDNRAKPQEGQNPFDYTPVADLQVQGHQIYRKAGMDEALTDNIFLMASGSGTGTTGATGTTTESPSGTSTGGAAGPGEANEVTFIEYDATADAPTMDLAQALQATGLPQTIQVGGKTLTASEVKLYDPDDFDEIAKARMVQGHSAYQGDDKDELILMAEPTMSGTPGTGTPPATGDQATTETPGGAAMMTGPIFIQYEEGTPDGATGNAPAPGRTP